MRIDYEDFKNLFFSDFVDYKSSYNLVMIKLDKMINLGDIIKQIYTIYKDKYLIFMNCDIEEVVLNDIKRYLEKNNIKYTITKIPYFKGINKLEYLEMLEGKI